MPKGPAIAINCSKELLVTDGLLGVNGGEGGLTISFQKWWIGCPFRPGIFSPAYPMRYRYPEREDSCLPQGILGKDWQAVPLPSP